MFMQAKFAVLIIVLACLLSPCIMAVKASSGEIDQIAVVDWVIDGDTFNVTSGETIRLADVDTPEYSEPGYSEAKNFMIDLIEGKTVYLDIDDVTRTDPYGRLVCVVYVDYNSTHYENVNKALLVENYAMVYDFNNNEFNPSNWTLHVSKTAIPEFPSFIILPALWCYSDRSISLQEEKVTTNYCEYSSLIALWNVGERGVRYYFFSSNLGMPIHLGVLFLYF
jgi:hypothetical protein